MRGFVLICLALMLKGDDDFITPREYAHQLYHNPRGIGCHLCHGEQGEGRVIATYRHKNEHRVVETKAIRDIPEPEFVEALERKMTGMPRYFLTLQERETLYRYLHQDDEDNVSAAE